MSNNFYAVINATTGISFYKYDSNTSKVTQTNQIKSDILLPAGNAKQLQIVDFAYKK